MPVTDEMREVVKQRLRERAARRFDTWAGGAPTAAALRDGRMDDDVCVRDALAAVDLILEAVYPAIRAAAVRESAEVAAEERRHLNMAAAKMKDQPEIFENAGRERELQALTAGEIEQSILALIGEDQVSQSPMGRLAAALAEELS